MFLSACICCGIPIIERDLFDFRIALGIWKVRARGVCLPLLLLCRCVPVVSLCRLSCFWCCVPVLLSLLSLLVLVLLLLLLLLLLLVLLV